MGTMTTSFRGLLTGPPRHLCRLLPPTLPGRCATKQPRGSNCVQSGWLQPGRGLTALGTRYRGDSAQCGLMRYRRTRVGGR